MAYQSLDLTLSPDSDDAIRAGWEAVTALGVPSEGGRTSHSHRPHLTLLAAPTMSPELLDLAVSRIGPLLPLRITLGAGVVFGHGPFVAAHLAVIPPSLGLIEQELQQHLLPRQTDAQSDGAGQSARDWIAHLTLSKKVPIDRLGEVMQAVCRHRPDFVQIDHLQHWDPACRVVTALV